jgi:glycosyltransferase involved in cell wall biosynthesis
MSSARLRTVEAAHDGGDATLVLYSKLAFYPVHWLALEEVVRRFRVRAVVLAAAPPELTSLHRQLGTAGPDRETGLPIEVRHMPTGSRRVRLAWLAQQLRAIRPDTIWVQEEPIDPFLLEMLALYRFKRRPRIVTAVCENIFPPPPAAEHLARRLLWPRLDGLMAVATPSIEGIRAAGMPDSVPAWNLVAGALEPDGEIEPLEPPFERREGDFVVGYAGNLTDQKGWRVLLRALEILPHEFKLVIAGDGPQLSELQAAIAEPPLRERSFYLGLLPKERLWGFYRVIDCLVMPSVTTERSKEQFGGVLCDAMVMGVPIVGSSSGAIPEVMGQAGIVAPEGDDRALADALLRLRGDPDLRARLSSAGPSRFRSEFAVPAYAGKIANALGLPPRSLASSE